MAFESTTTCLITGAAGFIGRNLTTALGRIDNVQVLTQVAGDSLTELDDKLAGANVVFHLAGANRPQHESDFQAINADLTAHLAEVLRQRSDCVRVIYSSSTQVDRDNLYGKSKRAGELKLLELSRNSSHDVYIYRLPAVFGKWSKPNYNTVVATFCHNIARDLPIQISDPDQELTLVYVDDVVSCFLSHLNAATDPPRGHDDCLVDVDVTHQITLGELARRIEEFAQQRKSKCVPKVNDPLTRKLYSTYLSFLPDNQYAIPVDLKSDDRGWLFELIKSPAFGQIFVSTTKPGITRGNHYHDSKVEKFCLIQGRGVIRFRDIESSTIIEYPVDDQSIEIVDIPPGQTHSIENTGQREMIVLFWANEIFDPLRPDTHRAPVINLHI